MNLHTSDPKQMRDAVKKLRHYMDTYDWQVGYADYQFVTLVNVVLYGLGIALDEEFSGPHGFEEFKSVLRNHLGNDPK